MTGVGKGKVYLVGAGPGDPKLITVRGREALRKSDTIVYDRLANPRLLTEAKPGAELIYVGKLPERHIMKQEEINRLLVDLAKQGKVVTRLKGGDPCVFGRVGEEAQLLAEHQIAYEIVPGVTSAIAVPAYAGIPVTHRDFASSMAVITGHENPAKLEMSVHWDKIAEGAETLVFLMGVTKIKYIRDQLIRCGRSPETPVALIRWGTRIEQKTLIGTLGNIAERVKAEEFKPPAVIVVGDVVKMREKLAWYEKKPLFGKRVLVTRARSQSSDLADLIDELGGEPIEFPTIQIQAPSKPEVLLQLDRALTVLAEYDWVIFTSVNGVNFFFDRIRALGVDIRQMHKAKIAAVGPKTEEALLDKGLISSVLPDKFQAEDLLDAILPDLKPGQKILLPRSEIARKYLPDKLREQGLQVTEAEVYETVLSNKDSAEMAWLLRNKKIHAITFTSSSTVKNFMELLALQDVTSPGDILSGIEIACIGPKTAETAARLGLNVTRMAKEATIASLVDALL